MAIQTHYSLFNNNKGLQIELWMVWLCGFLLITISFYATQILPPSKIKHQISNSNGPTITIFTAPKPFTGLIGEKQTLAINSWLSLSPNLTVILFSQDPSVFSFANSFNSRVLIEPNIDFTFLNTPFFHSMLARSQASSSNISVIIDPQIILLPDFISTIKFTHKLDQDWLLYTSSLLAWNNRDNHVPLHKGILPPFQFFGKIYYNWVIHEALSSNIRFIFDASSTISNLYMHDHISNDSELAINSHLASIYGSMNLHEANVSNFFKSFECNGHYMFINIVQNIVYLPNLRRSLSLRRLNTRRKILDCIGNKDWSMKNKIKLSASNLDYDPVSLEYLLSDRADENKTIVLAIAGYSYKDMLMSWVCRLRHLRITNYLVCALDHQIYEFSVIQGLPIFKYANPPTNQSFDKCHFGTECFQKVTKIKSKLVLQILKLGYNVLMSDVDVYWFKNPLPFLSSFGHGVLVAQSDEYKTTGPINLPRRLNSGFYYANSDDETINGLEKVVKHASKSNLSEQPSFYDTLCGAGGSYRVGENRCLEPETNLTTYFLDRDLFPNGAHQDLWLEKNVKSACVKKGCFVIHNNWISGRSKKLKRQILSGLWEYDISLRMCLWSWHNTNITTYF